MARAASAKKKPAKVPPKKRQALSTKTTTTPPSTTRTRTTADERTRKLKLQPLGDRVVVKSSEEETRTPGGIYLPDSAKEKPQEGLVLAVGPGKLTPEGKKIPMNVKVGDKVLFAKYGGNPFTIEGEEYLILDEDSIYAIRK